jgi:hypothetical protein
MNGLEIEKQEVAKPICNIKTDSGWLVRKNINWSYFYCASISEQTQQCYQLAIATISTTTAINSLHDIHHHALQFCSCDRTGITKQADSDNAPIMHQALEFPPVEKTSNNIQLCSSTIQCRPTWVSGRVPKCGTFAI